MYSVRCCSSISIYCMRNGVIIIISAIVLISGCGIKGGDGDMTTENKNIINTPAKILSYDYQRRQLVVAERHSYTPVFDSVGRLVSLDYMESGYCDRSLVTITTRTEAYQYDDSGSTAVATADWFFYNLGDPYGYTKVVTAIALDDEGRIQKTEIEDYSYTYKYTYNSGFLFSSYCFYKTEYIWSDGDLKRIITDDPMGDQTVDIEYSSDANPFADSVDPVLCSLMPEYYCFGILGRRTAHLPSSYTKTSKDDVQTFLFEYSKDEKGRIDVVEMKPTHSIQFCWMVVIHYED